MMKELNLRPATPIKGPNRRTTIKASLMLNLVVLVPICLGMVADAGWIVEAYGPATPARAILEPIWTFATGLSRGPFWLRLRQILAP